MMALYGVYYLQRSLGLDPYVSLAVMVPMMFAAGYLAYRYVIGVASHGRDENILLVTLGVAIVLENLALFLFKSDTRTIDTAYTFTTVPIGSAMIALPKIVAFFGAAATAGILLLVMPPRPISGARSAPARRSAKARAWSASTSSTSSP